MPVFFTGGDYELVILQRLVLPLSGVEIQYAAGLGGEVRIAGNIQAALVNLLHQITGCV
jgi:hypothetical protein